MLMKRTRIILAILAVSVAAAYAAEEKPSASPSGSPGAASLALKDDKDKLSYAIGTDIGRTLLRLEVEFNQGALTQGILDILNKKKTALSEEELNQTMQGFQQNLAQKQEQEMAKKQQEMKSTAEKNKTDGKKFLDDNGKKQGVTTLPDGLQYKVIKNGTGDKPKDTDTVEVNYKGTFVDGKEFDSSEKNGGPVSFPVNQVIKGWSEALRLMPVGSKWELYIPSDLAYGDEGEGEDIAPGATLVFEVELLSIKKESSAPQPTTGGSPTAHQ
jgi:FKBP-type peptidyl-prolyl cis-trans isomerase FklB